MYLARLVVMYYNSRIVRFAYILWWVYSHYWHTWNILLLYLLLTNDDVMH